MQNKMFLNQRGSTATAEPFWFIEFLFETEE